jgi:hypothetical protein
VGDFLGSDPAARNLCNRFPVLQNLHGALGSSALTVHSPGLIWVFAAIIGLEKRSTGLRRFGMMLADPHGNGKRRYGSNANIASGICNHRAFSYKNL